MFEQADEITVDGQTIKRTQEWNPYNPVHLETGSTHEITVKAPTLEELDVWIKDYILGYNGLTVKKYLDMDPELLKDRMDNHLVNTHEFVLLNLLYRILLLKGKKEDQVIYQMPEDFAKSFGETDDTRDLIFGKSEKYKDLLFLKSIVTMNPVHNNPGEPATQTYPVYSLKAIYLWIVSYLCIVKNGTIGGEVTFVYKDLCEVYRAFQDEFWNFDLEHKQKLSRSLNIHRHHVLDGYLANGYCYSADCEFTLISEFVNNLKHFLKETLSCQKKISSRKKKP